VAGGLASYGKVQHLFGKLPKESKQIGRAGRIETCTDIYGRKFATAKCPKTLWNQWCPRFIRYERRIRGASIYPAVQNIILACRAFGLGTLITTNHIRCEDEVKALLCLPSDVSTYALMPIGYPQGKFGPLARRPVGEVAYADRWGGAPWEFGGNGLRTRTSTSTQHAPK
jgi:nitroreductase